MTEEYRYRPPLKYLFVGMGGLIASAVFGMAIGKNGILFSIIATFLCMMMLTMGTAFLLLFFRRFTAKKLRIADQYIEIPGRWKKRVRLNAADILSVRAIETYDIVIEIQSTRGVHLIERNWMRPKDFDRVNERLRIFCRTVH